MKVFLTTEFGEQFSSDVKYKVILSPFVLRMNCHRSIDSKTIADFITIPDYVLTDTISVKEEDIAASIHNLFTEMDHGYVNPTTDKYNLEEFFIEEIWDDESGYADSGKAVFNEYMTWAVYDIFNSIHFPEIAEKINLNWHFQNDTRGFIYSNLFASKLRELYHKYKGKKKIKDLYPEVLEWTDKIQPTLSKPLLLNDSDTLRIGPKKSIIRLQFSEPMEKAKNFDLVLQFSQWEKDVLKIGSNNNLIWDESGKALSFEIELPEKDDYYLLLNWWGVENPLVSKKGIMLQATSGLIIQGNSAQNKG